MAKNKIELPNLGVTISFSNIDVILERARFEENIGAEIIVRHGRPLTDEVLRTFFKRNKDNVEDYEVPEISNLWLGWCKRATMRY